MTKKIRQKDGKNVLVKIYVHYCTKVWEQNIFFKEINIFIQQECIKLIKSDSKDIYNHITSCIKQFKSIRLQWIIAWNYGSSNWENKFFKPFLQKYIAKKIFFYLYHHVNK